MLAALRDYMHRKAGREPQLIGRSQSASKNKKKRHRTAPMHLTRAYLDMKTPRCTS